MAVATIVDRMTAFNRTIVSPSPHITPWTPCSMTGGYCGDTWFDHVAISIDQNLTYRVKHSTSRQTNTLDVTPVQEDYCTAIEEFVKSRNYLVLPEVVNSARQECCSSDFSCCVSQRSIERRLLAEN